MVAMTFNQGQIIDPEQTHRSMLAKLLIEQSQAPYSGPVVAPSQNLARVLSAIGGNLLLAKEAQQQKLNQAQDLGTMQQALNASKTAWVNPDTGTERAPSGEGFRPIPSGATLIPPGGAVPTGSTGGVGAMASVMALSPRLAPQAMQLQFQAIANEQAQKQAMATKLLEHGLTVGPGGRIIPLPGYGESRGSIEGLVAGGAEAGKNKPLIERKEAEKVLDQRYDPTRAKLIAEAENPALINRAVSTHAGTRAIDVRTAGDLEANQVAGRGRAELSPVNVGGNIVPLAEALAGVRARGTETGNLTARTQPGPGGKPLGQAVAEQTAQGSGTGANTAALTPVETPQGVMPAAAAVSAAHSAGAAQGNLQPGPGGVPLVQGVAQATATGAGQGQTAAALTPTVNPATGQTQPAAQIQAQVQAAGHAAGTGGKDIPPAVATTMLEHTALLRSADEALKKLEAYPDAVGAKAYLPEVLLQKVDPGGVDARASMAQVTTNIVHALAGASQTAGEVHRLSPYIPQPTDDFETAVKKFKGFQSQYRQIIQDQARTYSADQGYKENPVVRDFLKAAGSPTAAGPPVAPSVPKLSDQELLNKLGYK